MTRRLAHSSAVSFAALVMSVAGGCGNRQNQVIPNRVLDRPLDVALACVREVDGVLTPQSLEQCSDAVAETVCGELRLLGFVANSERNDIAMFSRCAGAVIDMDVSAPGPQLISAGEVPSSMTVTTGVQAGCFTIAANLGSCDLSVLDVGGLAAYAFDEPPDEDPAAYVSNVVPRRADGTPLGARPGQVLAVPPDLSNTGDASLVCDPANPGSVYVTFPSCQLIAEVDLRTQRILQSRQFVRGDNDAITVVDAGADPICPVDCAEQFMDPQYADALANAPSGDPDGMYPLAMALVTPPSDPAACVDTADLMIEDVSLYVGGLGSDTIYELRYDGKSWTDDPLEFEVTSAQGISAIRPTPAMEMHSGNATDFYQFLYVLAGDGSTRVVRREFSPNRTELGSECDTQVDPTAVTNTACHPAEFPGAQPPDRRPFARGPGIRAPNGALITDWTFQKWYDEQQVREAGGSYERCAAGPGADSPDSGSDTRTISSPFTGPGVVGVGSTSFGRLIFGVFDQFQGRAGVSDTYDYLGVLDAQIPPHSLWPNVDPTLPTTLVEGLPRMEDKEPDRLLPGGLYESTLTRVLAPSLRRIDRAYQTRTPCKSANDCDDNAACEIPDNQNSGYCEQIDPALSPPVADLDQDRLARADEDEDVATRGLYVNDVVRAVVRDYPTWTAGQWNVHWEGEIPGTSNFNGQIVCDTPGWEGGTCLSTTAGDTRLLDQTAQFCDRGVLGGDKLFINGCSTDSNCGTGQYCLLDPLAPANSTGLCVSKVAYEQGREELLQICRPFLRDECGAARREFAVTRAFQQELWLQVLDKPLDSYVMMRSVDTPADAEVTDEEREALCRGDRVAGSAIDDQPTCARLQDDPACGTAGALPCCSGDYVYTAEGPGFVECEERLSCAPNQPDNGCAGHDDCAAIDAEFPLCIDGTCRRVCGPDEDCAQTPLPGPTCFRELLNYHVRARNSFIVRGPGPYDFLPQKVKTDPDSGECFEDPEVSNLLTSRIRLGSDEEDTRYNTLWPIPSCPATASRPDGGAPNPCFVDTPRPDALSPDTVSALYHFFNYGEVGEEQPVPAIRYSNPMMSFVLDLTSLQDLAGLIPGTEDGTWPAEFAGFRRARIPGLARESFSTRLGYSPYDALVTTQTVALVGPTRIINAPELSTVFVVDSSGGSSGRGTRGQVVRVSLAGGQVSPDVRFLVR